MWQWEFCRLDDSFYEKLDLLLSAVVEKRHASPEEEKVAKKAIEEALCYFQSFLRETLPLGEQYFLPLLVQVLLQRAEEREVSVSPLEVQFFLQSFLVEIRADLAEWNKGLGLEGVPAGEIGKGVEIQQREQGLEAPGEGAGEAGEGEAAEIAVGEANERNGGPGLGESRAQEEPSNGIAASREKLVGLLEWSLSALFPSCSLQLLYDNGEEVAFYIPDQQLVLWAGDDIRDKEEGKKRRKQLLVQRLGRSKLQELQVVEVNAEEARNHHLLLRVLRRATWNSRIAKRTGG